MVDGETKQLTWVETDGQKMFDLAGSFVAENDFKAEGCDSVCVRDQLFEMMQQKVVASDNSYKQEDGRNDQTTRSEPYSLPVMVDGETKQITWVGTDGQVIYDLAASFVAEHDVKAEKECDSVCVQFRLMDEMQQLVIDDRTSRLKPTLEEDYSSLLANKPRPSQVCRTGCWLMCRMCLKILYLFRVQLLSFITFCFVN
jgi:hypothetical protein